jgi:uncharacterized protein
MMQPLAIKIAGMAFFAALCSYNQGQSLLWRISSGALPADSYIFGTIHVRDSRVFSMADSVLLAQEACDATVLEMDLGAGAAKKLSKMLMLPAGQSLSDFYSADELARIETIISDRTGMPFSLFGNLHPVALLTATAGTYFSADMPYSLDETLQKRAISLGKEIKGLETIDMQLAALTSFSPEDVLAYLTDTAQAGTADDLIEAYLRADIEELAGLLDNDSIAGKYSAQLLHIRNKGMAASIIELAMQQSCFFAVGAAHLGGSGGIIERLKNRGFSVQAVPGASNPANLELFHNIGAAIKWQTVSLQTAKLQMPGQPTDFSAAGAASYASVAGNDTFMALGLKADIADFSKHVADAARKIALASGGQITSNTLSGRGYIDVTIESPMGTMAQRHFYRNGIYYMIQMSGTDISPQSVIYDHFFSSFLYTD